MIRVTTLLYSLVNSYTQQQKEDSQLLSSLLLTVCSAFLKIPQSIYGKTM